MHSIFFLSVAVTLRGCLHAFSLKHGGSPLPVGLHVEEWSLLSLIHSGLECPSVRFETRRKQKF